MNFSTLLFWRRFVQCWCQPVFGKRKIQAANETTGTNIEAHDLIAQALTRLKNMKMLKRLLSLTWLSRSWRRRPKGKSSTFPQPVVDPEEFARLIGSGRVEDLRTLARKLSGQPKAHV